MKVLGLTGGIGSGKTTVAGFFRDLGVPVYIADEKAKVLMNADPRVKTAVIELFGEQAYENGLLNRKWIASQVFSNTEKLEKLNAIVHPAVAKNFEQWQLEHEVPYVVYEAAILFEKGGYKKCDFNLMITAPREQKILRLQRRDNSSLEEIEARMNNQWPDEKKAKLADFVLENIDLSKTRKEVLNIHEKILKSA